MRHFLGVRESEKEREKKKGGGGRGWGWKWGWKWGWAHSKGVLCIHAGSMCFKLHSFLGSSKFLDTYAYVCVCVHTWFHVLL
jgi:hypothetical protein